MTAQNRLFGHFLDLETKAKLKNIQDFVKKLFFRFEAFLPKMEFCQKNAESDSLPGNGFHLLETIQPFAIDVIIGLHST